MTEHEVVEVVAPALSPELDAAIKEEIEAGCPVIIVHEGEVASLEDVTD